MNRTVVVMCALTLLGVAPAYGQVSLGAATASGITVHPPTAAAVVSPPAQSEPQPGPQHGVQPAAHGGDLFLADPYTYAPRFRHRPRGRVHPILFPYVVGGAPYFGPHDFTAADLYPASGTSTIEQASAHGLLRLDVEPGTAQVYVDGFFVGSAGDLRSALPLGTGSHRLEVKADGFETVAFDVRVRPNAMLRLTHRLVRAGGDAVIVRGTQDVTAVRLNPDSTTGGVTADDATGASPPVVARPAVATTLYVIPRCYAGDRRPDPSDLPAGCRIGDLRVIRPGTQ
jgi:hypothetical protein